MTEIFLLQCKERKKNWHKKGWDERTSALGSGTGIAATEVATAMSVKKERNKSRAGRNSNARLEPIVVIPRI